MNHHKHTSLAIVLLLGAGIVSPLSHAGETKTAKVELLPSDGDGGKYWPQWRGPTRQGIVTEGAYPDTWSVTKNVLWKVKTTGQGNSSPIIWGDRIFLSTAYQKGKKRAIVCLRRSDGKQLWESFVPEGMVERTQRKNGYASGTPVTDGERVYAYYGNYGLFCVDFHGKMVWHKKLAPMKALHGMACSPLLYKDKVIIFQDNRGDTGGFVLAVDKLTGKVAWKTPRQEKVGWGSPVAVRVDGQDQIIVSSSRKVYAYNPADGKVLWTCKGNLFEVTPTPVAGHGLLFCCSGRRGPTLAIRPTGTGDITKTHLSWKTIKGSPFIPSPLLYGEHLYMINDIISVVTCYNAKTGELMYQERLSEPVKHGFSASPIGVGGKIYFTTDEGDTYVLKAGPKYELLHVNRLGERTLASPALVDGQWYIRTAEHLYCIGTARK